MSGKICSTLEGRLSASPLLNISKLNLCNKQSPGHSLLLKERDFFSFVFFNSFYLLLKRKNVYNDMGFFKRANIFYYWHYLLLTHKTPGLKTETIL